jgi:putative selenium metabolism protein SsnA
MKTILGNATIIELHPPRLRRQSVCLVDGAIHSLLDPDKHDSSDADEIVDCTGKLIMPALVVGHTHLYSALAVGMPPPARQPESFVQILEEIWWKLDRALDEEGVYYSALVGAMRAATSGVGTVIDHHASPNSIPGSLDIVKGALERVGLRGVLCYEVTDRNGLPGARQGIEENARFLSALRKDGLCAGLVGAHASFTLGDETLGQLADLADEHSVGVHVHCAEASSDNEDSLRRCGKPVARRLADARILRPGTVLAHCTHLDEESIGIVQDTGCWVAHNPRSNMNNSVGYPRISALARGNLALGTDGIDADMFAESKTAFFKSRDARAELAFDAPLGWLAGASRLASECLGVPLGNLDPGSPADLTILDYQSATPLSGDNIAGHWFFGMNSAHVESMIVGGRWVLRKRVLTFPAAYDELQRARLVAERTWQRLREL